MKTAAALLALLLAFPPLAPAAGVETSTTPAAVISTEPFTAPLTVTAPRVSEKEVLKTARVAGAGTAVAGGGLMAYSILFAAGPFGWAAALVFLGGMTSYLSHRRLQGKEDFKWGAAPQPPPEGPKTAQP
ncbi:MAG: hypothetical protein NUW21_12345 [Elusimicrobia bacterium]|nr:hypothetical protein [Elusimicrobiota bacterium]